MRLSTYIVALLLALSLSITLPTLMQIRLRRSAVQMTDTDDFELPEIDEDKDYSQAVTESQPEFEVDNDCGDACKL